jgi:ribosome maturation factor RimP
MASTRTADDTRELVAPLVGALGFRLYDVEISGSGRARTVRVLVDRDGGVDLDAITEATHAISPALDDAPFLTGPFLLEVSSPGLERPLRRLEHYAGAVGETVTMTYQKNDGHTGDGPRRVRGILAEAADDHCVVDADGTRITVPYAAVTKARTVFEWGPEPRERAKKPRGRAKEHS